MKRLLKAGLAAVVLAGTVFGLALAQGEGKQVRFGDDLYAAGEDVRLLGTGLEDAFAAGQSVVVGTPLKESAHLAGREVRVEQSVGRDVYAAASDVAIRAPVIGDVTVFGEEVEISAAIGDDVIAMGRKVVLAGPVAGNAMLMGETVEISGVITGSVRVRADTIRFGPGARIDGTLAWWSENAITVPPSVISPDRVTGKRVSGAEVGPVEAGMAASVAERAIEIASGLLVLLILGAIFGAIVPDRLADARDGVASHFWSHLLYGTIAMSALFGAIFVFAVSIIGIPLILVMLLVIPLALLVGYLTAGYVLGSLALRVARVPSLGGGRLSAIASTSAGLVLLCLIKLIPLLGWIIAVLAVIVGLGAWFVILARPKGAAPAEA